ncbi:hypothetical protein KAFR_0K01590 [Kazachstania africana CBS 2517]|uniref:PH domain-containing protein n=1 Tax=Kazachstania africana (strain ATCC 22294 / BCRC 22015 / CBS 2517 / CECT 1963 / NBRC 1671 / NRRL Y-8276) TaxID=1071382 RepID=H2B1L3_KAZAF|nr:hypothetical protein KAFR_0K01590 [Kazachstania africana CBS 2517]CCF60513.1 hypothetical protein KAFR_0K01590 [Kazachstania africana CBS 2517]
MSDYFSVKPPGSAADSGSSTPSQLKPNYNRTSSRGMGDDASSIHSSNSQYLMDALPDNLTLKDNVTYSHINTKDYILPKTDEKSPYYVGVPIPNPLPSPGIANESTPSVDASTAPSEGESEAYLVREYPTDILADRFYKWRKILKALIAYLREVAYAQEQFARVNHHLKSSVKFSFLTDIQDGSNKLYDPLLSTKNQQPLTRAQQKLKEQEMENGIGLLDAENPIFNNTHYKENKNRSSTAASGFMNFGTGSIQDIQVILKKHHLAQANQQFKVSKEIVNSLIPNLENLRKDLQFKIKDIKDLHNDFRTNINAHIKLTGQLLNKYIGSIKYMNTHDSLNNLQPKHDPYLLKLQLDLQLKRQTAEENYLQEAFVNLQTSGLKLEKIVYSKIQNCLQRYSALIDSEARLMIKNVCQELQHGILSKPPAMEWDNFVSHHPLCLINWKSNDPMPNPRKISDIVYPNMKSPIAKCIRAGYFIKKSNFAKEYNKGYFVLTPNFLHEFKTSDFFNMGSKNTSTSTTNMTDVSSLSVATPSTSSSTVNLIHNPHHHKKGNSFIPILSIPLNECQLIDSTADSFTLKGRASFIEFQRTASGQHHSRSKSTPYKLEQNALPNASAAKKSTFSKLLRPVKSKHQKKEDLIKKQKEAEIIDTRKQESTNGATWTFKPIQESPTDEEKKHFKKWIQDLNTLTSFSNVNERIKFLDERILKGYHQRSKSAGVRLTASNHTPTSEFNGNASSYFEQNSPMQTNQSGGRPHYIQLQNTNNPSSIELNFRSRINTPAIDDNGNLITMAERRPGPLSNGSYFSYSPSHSGTYTPALSPNYSFNSDGSNNSQSSGQQQYVVNTPAGISITSNGIRQVHSLTNIARHQRNVSLPNSLMAMNNNVVSVHSPNSLNSDNSQGGYFAIPLHSGDQQQQQQVSPNLSRITTSHNSSIIVTAPSPNPEELTKKMTFPLSRTSSRGTTTVGTRHASIGSQNTIPKSPANDQEVKEQLPSLPHLKKTPSTGSLPTMTVTDNGTAPSDAPFYQRGNGSATNLTSSRVHTVRKHKKNVSFSSLNSLMFSKKNNSGFAGNQILHGGGILEADDDGDSGDEDKAAIKLNRSIYS